GPTHRRPRGLHGSINPCLAPADRSGDARGQRARRDDERGQRGRASELSPHTHPGLNRLLEFPFPNRPFRNCTCSLPVETGGFLSRFRCPVLYRVPRLSHWPSLPYLSSQRPQRGSKLAQRTTTSVSTV